MNMYTTSQDYKAITETLYITSIPGMKESILKASKEPIENFSDEINFNDVEYHSSD